MSALSNELMLYIALLGSLCVGSAVIGAIFAKPRSRTPWPRYFAAVFGAFGLLAATTAVGVLWMQWIDFDRGIRASIETAQSQGYEVQESLRSDGTLVFKIRNYVVPDGSFSIVANRTPFRPAWSFIAIWSVLCGIVAACVSSLAQKIARQFFGVLPA